MLTYPQGPENGIQTALGRKVESLKFVRTSRTGGRVKIIPEVSSWDENDRHSSLPLFQFTTKCQQ